MTNVVIVKEGWLHKRGTRTERSHFIVDLFFNIDGHFASPDKRELNSNVFHIVLSKMCKTLQFTKAFLLLSVGENY